jgi:8-oxo-dGTP pyrophosphatase MutT (NUDIX family)
VSVITPAASVLLSRGPGSREIFAILRGRQLKFFGGFWAFPGGKLTTLEAESLDRLEARRHAACRETPFRLLTPNCPNADAA